MIVRPKPENWRSIALPVAGLFALVALAYFPALTGEFLWDDAVHVTSNLITKPDGLRASWFSTMQPNYWPLTWTAFWAEWRLFGTNPMGYHAVNILLQFLNALLVWRLLRELAVPGAWVAAAVFAVHPVSVESVAWITQLKTLLSAGLCLASLLLFVLFVKQEKTSVPHHRGHRGSQRKQTPQVLRFPALYFASLAGFGLSLLAKSVTVALPIVMLIMRWWQQRRITRRDFLLVVPFLAFAAAMGCVEIWSQSTIDTEHGVPHVAEPMVRLARSGWIVGFYLWKLVVPRGLLVIYPKWIVDPTQLVAWLPLTALVAAFVVMLAKRATWGRHGLFAMGSYVAMLFPALGFIDFAYMGHSYVADHFQYVASVAPIALIVAGATVVIRKQWVGRPALRVLPATVLCAGLLVLTFRQTLLYRTNEALWLATLEKNPKALTGYCLLADWYAVRGDKAKAMQYYHAGINALPDDACTYNNMANVLLHMGDWDGAIRDFRRAIALQPNAVLQHFNLGTAQESAGRLEDAAESYKRELEISPRSYTTSLKLGMVLQRLGRHAEAEEVYRQTVIMKPNSQTAVCYLGRAIAAQGRTSEAVVVYREAIRMQPGDWEAHANLGIALTALKDYEGAIAELEIAAQLKPQRTEIRRLLDEAIKSRAQEEKSRP